MISVLVVNFNTAALLRPMFDACAAASVGLDCHYWVLDNASTDNSVEVMKRDFGHAALLVNSQNVGFGRANNQLLCYVQDEFVLLINTDAFVAPDTLHKTLEYMKAHPKVGVLGVRLVGRDGVLQPCCRYFPTPWNTFVARTGLSRVFKNTQLVDDMAWAHDAVRACDWVVGCYYLVRKELIDQIGLFDPRYFLYFEEVDHCFAAKKAGWDVVFYPHTTVVHIGGESAKSVGVITKGGRQLEAMEVESELLYFRKNHGLFAAWSSLVLSVLAEGINLTKAVIKRRRPLDAPEHWQRVKLVCRLFVATRMGAVPTR